MTNPLGLAIDTTLLIGIGNGRDACKRSYFWYIAGQFYWIKYMTAYNSCGHETSVTGFVKT